MRLRLRAAAATLDLLLVAGGTHYFQLTGCNALVLRHWQLIVPARRRNALFFYGFNGELYLHVVAYYEAAVVHEIAPLYAVILAVDR